MMGLILKDIYSLRKYFLKQIFYISAMYLILAVTVLHTISFIGCMMIMSIMMMLISSFSIDESAKWDAYALTLPITHRSLVGAKYLLFYGTLVIVGVSTSLICGVVDAFTFKEGIEIILGSSGAIMALYALVSAIFLPVVYKMGAEKARIVLTLCFIIPFIGIFWAANYLGQESEGAQNIMNFLENLPWPLVVAAAVLILILLVLASFFLAVKFHEQKDF